MKVHGSFLGKINIVSEILWNGNIPDMQEEGNKKPHSFKVVGNKPITSRGPKRLRNIFSQVFWLLDLSTPCAFPQNKMQWLVQVSSPVTAAGPRRILTVFPMTE